MSKDDYLAKLADLYRAANMADQPEGADWMKWQMAGDAGCGGFDVILREMQACGALSAEEVQSFYDNL